MNVLRWLSIQLAGLQEQARVTEELNRLSDRNLADIGLSPADVRTVARQARKSLVAELMAAPISLGAPAHSLRFQQGLGSVQ
jgi:uncharacterized protein YjiS (DUF1127 family)